jgi:NAD(P)-dependent dehydrogenase (short-subunit alcohol dehydrogenase family)
MGRGLLENAPDVVAGTYMGEAGDPALTRLVENADVLVLLGVISRIINIASIAGLRGGGGDMQMIAYHTSKRAVVNFTRALAAP